MRAALLGLLLIPALAAQAPEHWAWSAPTRPTPPAVDDAAWRANPIDAFVRERLDQAGLPPTDEAPRRVLARRLYFDMLGLPPTPEQVEAFASDPDPNAYEKLVDTLLASPHYGERQARHWLDLVRYAESNSFERDNPKPFVWRYRDWVIRAFNADVPYDEFVRLQLAGDELDEVTADSIIATGFYRLGAWDDEPADREQALFDDLDDIVATTSQAFMGLTMNCARCHDHKLDPIPQRDYYRLLAYFRNVRRLGVRSPQSVVAASVRVIASPEEQARHAASTRAHREELKALETRLKAIHELVKPDFAPVEHEEWKSEGRRVALVRKRAGDVIHRTTADEFARTFREWRRLRRSPPRGLEQALCVKETTNDLPTHVLLRGNPHLKGDAVTPGLPKVLGSAEPEIVRPASGESLGRRRALAGWLTNPTNPLTARVWVNRLWQYRFGEGLVASPNNFGLEGRPPTHPELLDWLATELVQNGWSSKHLHRLIVTSKTWKQDFRRDAHAEQVDPANALRWRFEPRRLTAEELRDSILAVNGKLDLKQFGPSIYPTIPREVLAGQSRPGQNWNTSPAEAQNRRTIYVHVKRSLLLPIVEAFDAADTDFTCPVRFQTTQPTQALHLLNSDFCIEQSKKFADGIEQPGHAFVAEVLRRATQRPPHREEIDRALQFMADLREQEGFSDAQARARFCLVAINLNEFLYVR